jgi:DNA/RNA endonuclease G (NUC1)
VSQQNCESKIRNDGITQILNLDIKTPNRYFKLITNTKKKGNQRQRYSLIHFLINNKFIMSHQTNEQSSYTEKIKGEVLA